MPLFSDISVLLAFFIDSERAVIYRNCKVFRIIL